MKLRSIVIWAVLWVGCGVIEQEPRIEESAPAEASASMDERVSGESRFAREELGEGGSTVGAMVGGPPAVQLQRWPFEPMAQSECASGKGFTLSQLYGQTCFAYVAKVGGNSGYSQTGYMHSGLDFAIPGKTKLYAVADGEVVCAGAGSCEWGGMTVCGHPAATTMNCCDVYPNGVCPAPEQRYHLVIQSGDARILYGHVYKTKAGLTVGAQVKAGDELGESGDASGPHLHFEVRHISNEGFDPVAFFPLRDQEMVREGFTVNQGDHLCRDDLGSQPSTLFGQYSGWVEEGCTSWPDAPTGPVRCADGFTGRAVTVCTPPLPPVPQQFSPAGGAHAEDFSPTFRWRRPTNPSGYPLTYDIEVKSPDGVVQMLSQDTVCNVFGTGDCYTSYYQPFPTKYPVGPTQWMWRARSRQNGQYSTWASTSFTPFLDSLTPSFFRPAPGQTIDLKDWQNRMVFTVPTGWDGTDRALTVELYSGTTLLRSIIQSNLGRTLPCMHTTDPNLRVCALESGYTTTAKGTLRLEAHPVTYSTMAVDRTRTVSVSYNQP
ncbi:M23 family metallopeptidase [Stigmatella sp. ncwal1]|uniref:M23 family metallopeptidase n=1 Tax=Stigmatella ashevillensis TaxID=2995309 RepID=A0ABT5DPQ1_9BACT|nr:M23 family metallopeptidase [Stigmatella ashevillena]MDC0714362.1 M23 family metallopeptidase [Stigmatella ashevillena]